jgi:hypothetical protein
VNAPLSREAIQALLLYLAQYPESQPMDFILTSHGKPMTSSAVYQRIRNAVGQLTEMRLGELRAWARRTLTDRPSPPSPERPIVQRHTHNIGIAALKARYANRR